MYVLRRLMDAMGRVCGSGHMDLCLCYVPNRHINACYVQQRVAMHSICALLDLYVMHGSQQASDPLPGGSWGKGTQELARYALCPGLSPVLTVILPSL